MEASWNIKHEALHSDSQNLVICYLLAPNSTLSSRHGQREQCSEEGLYPNNECTLAQLFDDLDDFDLEKSVKNFQHDPDFDLIMRFCHLYPNFPFFWGLWHSQAPFGWRDCWACLVAWKEGFQKKGSCTRRIWAAFDGLQSHWPTESWCKATACSEFCL